MKDLFSYHCFDTSALVTMWRKDYRPQSFPTVWRLMELVIDAGELIAPREVYDELQEGQDDLLEFVRAKQCNLIKDLDEEQIKLMFEIKARFPQLSDDKKIIPDADPFVIALARQKGWKVVTSESDRSPIKIPAACKHYGIPCLSPADFIEEKKWVI